MSNGRHKWENRSDEWLVEVLRSGDNNEVNDALALLQGRHDKKLRKYVTKRLEPDWVDDVMANTWEAFYQRVQRDNVKSVPRMLQAIARNKRADAVEQFIREREIETDVPPTGEFAYDNEQQMQSLEDELDETDEQILEQLGMTLIEQVPFVDSVLSDCQRTLWVLRKIYKYPSKQVARLIGKTDDNIRKQYSIARQKLAAYFLSNDFKLAVQTRTVPTILKPAHDFESAICIELFAEEAKPRFTRAELKPLGISSKRLRDNYVVSLVMPRWFAEGEDLETNRPSILLLHKDVRFDWIKSMYDLKNYPDLRDPFAPEQFLVNFEVEEDQIILRPETMVEIAADLYAETSDNTYIAAHSPRFISPIIWGYWDSSLYFDDETFTAEMQQRWPFLPLDSDRKDWHDYHLSFVQNKGG